MPILSNPGTFTYLANPAEAFEISGIGPIRKQDDALSITEQLGSPGTCHLTVGDHEGSSDPEPAVGTTVEISTFGRRIFAGTVVETAQVIEAERINRLKWITELVDPTWTLNRLIPFGTFESVSATTVVAELAGDYAPGFTLNHVQAALPAVTLELDGSLTWAGVLDDICRQLGGAIWKVDHDFDLHLTLEPEVDEVPDDLVDGSATLLVDPALRKSTSLASVRTRVYVRGTGAFAMREDTVKQAALAALVGGDGVYEGPVVSRPELTTEADCEAYGDALLELWGQPVVTLDYYTRDPKTATGKTVTANLTDPPVVGTFRIQAVQIDRVAMANGFLYPRWHVTASSVLFTIEDLFRRQQAQNITGNAGTATRLGVQRLIHGSPFDGSADIDLSKRIHAESGLRVLS